MECFSLTGEKQAAPEGGPRALDTRGAGPRPSGWGTSMPGRGSDHSSDLWRPEASQEVGLAWGGDLELSRAPCAVTIVPLSPALCLQCGNILTKWRLHHRVTSLESSLPGSLDSQIPPTACSFSISRACCESFIFR